MVVVEVEVVVQTLSSMSTDLYLFNPYRITSFYLLAYSNKNEITHSTYVNLLLHDGGGMPKTTVPSGTKSGRLGWKLRVSISPISRTHQASINHDFGILLAINSSCMVYTSGS